MNWRRRGLGVVAAAVVTTLAGVHAQQQPATTETPVTSGKLKVTVNYTGAGPVNADHQIFVWVFDTPNITAESTPLSAGAIKENHGSYSFAALPKEVYIAAAYDEKGGYDGTSGPPPQGTPVTIHGAKAAVTGTAGSSAGMGAASPVETGGDAATVTVTFDDSMRMP
jgi:hypothetical protein